MEYEIGGKDLGLDSKDILRKVVDKRSFVLLLTSAGVKYEQ